MMLVVYDSHFESSPVRLATKLDSLFYFKNYSIAKIA